MPETIQTKQCSKCKQVLPISEFHKNKQKKDGHSYHCKICDNLEGKQYYERNKTKILQRTRQYNKQHPNMLRQAKSKYQKTLYGHLHRLFDNMFARCNSHHYLSYHRYGGRGIKVKFASFDDFFDYVVNELKVDPRGLTIDRIDNDGHYEKGNIRFVTQAKNCQNRKSSTRIVF